jgi:hypothetical protein
MQGAKLSRPVCLLLLVGMIAGCAPDREALLIGKWSVSPMYAPLLAFQLKESEGTDGATAMAGARKLASMAMDIRKDKTFLLFWAGSTMHGTWTFDEESGEMLLNITRVEVPQASQGDRSLVQPGVWVANLDPDNKRLRVMLGDAKNVALVQKSGGPLADGIPLKKDEEQ